MAIHWRPWAVDLFRRARVRWAAESISDAEGTKSTARIAVFPSLSPDLPTRIEQLRPERREMARTPGLILSPEERERARDQERAVDGCGSRWMRLSRTEGGQDERLLVPLGCGRRACPDCGASALRYHFARVHQDREAGFGWRQFWTFTVPPAHGGAESFRKGNARIQRLLRWVRDEARAGRIRLDGSRLEYTWSLERQQEATQSPHWHVLTNVLFFDWAALTRKWQQIVGTAYANTDYRSVKNEEQLMAYICKYVAKEQLPPDLLAVMYRKRLFASTVPAPKKTKRGWMKEEEVPSDVAESETECPGAFQPGLGWKVVWNAPGKGARWSRPARMGKMTRQAFALEKFNELHCEMYACGVEGTGPGSGV
jgi:hypothetical protein